jgi:Type II secretion system (T2SS), protein M subtype b
MSLWRRILEEKRALIIPLVLGVLGNVAAYALWVYPLGVKSAGAADRAVAATRSVQAAERELASARELVAGQSRADQELKTFFDKVLPPDLPSARNLTYATLPSLAKKSNVKMMDRRFEVAKPEKNARLGLLKVHTAWQGDYESFRQFIYALESASPFVIIDDVALAQGDPNKPLMLTLELSTYYRLASNGN